MALDPNTWTLKTTEAVNAALAAAKERNNPEVTPAHLLAALLRQEDGVVLPIVRKVGLQPVDACATPRTRRSPRCRPPTAPRPSGGQGPASA